MTRLTCNVMVPRTHQYPYEAIHEGLQAAGVLPAADYTQADVLVTWSPWHGSNREHAMSGHRGPVIVMENGWLQPIAGKRYWSVCLWGWNGTGVWPAPHDEGYRLYGQLRPISSLIYDKSYHNGDGPVVVVEQRGHTSDRRTMPTDWHRHTALGLDNAGHYVLMRRKADTTTPLDFLYQYRPKCVVTWSSAFASWAVLVGVPVIYCGPSIWTWEIGQYWSGRGALPMSRPVTLELMAAQARIMRALAWSQWTEEEIAAGTPFKRLLG